jgi:hypothetical protein
MDLRQIVRNVPGNVATSLLCTDSGNVREGKGRRALRIGSLLPNIVLYNDPTPHPSTDTTTKVISADLRRKPDLLLIFGTSLKVHGIKRLVKEFAELVHANKGIVILINKSELAKIEWKGVIDYWIEADCDTWVNDLKARVPELWMKQESLPIMPKVKPVSGKRGNISSVRANIAPKRPAQDKENIRPMTPTKVPTTTYMNSHGLPSPLSPSKRGLNRQDPVSPTKRLHRETICAIDDEPWSLSTPPSSQV